MPSDSGGFSLALWAVSMFRKDSFFVAIQIVVVPLREVCRAGNAKFFAKVRQFQERLARAQLSLQPRPFRPLQFLPAFPPRFPGFSRCPDMRLSQCMSSFTASALDLVLGFFIHNHKASHY